MLWFSIWIIYTITIANVNAACCAGPNDECKVIPTLSKCEATNPCKWTCWFKITQEHKIFDFTKWENAQKAWKKILADIPFKFPKDVHKSKNVSAPRGVKTKISSGFIVSKEESDGLLQIKSTADEVSQFRLITCDSKIKMTVAGFDKSVIDDANNKQPKPNNIKNKIVKKTKRKRRLAMTGVGLHKHEAPSSNVGQIRMQFWKAYDPDHIWQHAMIDQIYTIYNQFNQHNPVVFLPHDQLYDSAVAADVNAALVNARKVGAYFRTWETNQDLRDAADTSYNIVNIMVGIPQQYTNALDAMRAVFQELQLKGYGGEYVAGQGVGTIIKQNKIPASTDYYIYVLTNGHIGYHKRQKYENGQHVDIPEDKRPCRGFQFVHVNEDSNDQKAASGGRTIVISSDKFDRAWYASYKAMDEQVNDWALIRFKVNAKINNIKDKIKIRSLNGPTIQTTILTYDYHTGAKNRMVQKTKKWKREQWLSLLLDEVDGDYKEGMSGSGMFASGQANALVAIFRGRQANTRKPVAVRITFEKAKIIKKLLEGNWDDVSLNQAAVDNAHVEYVDDIYYHDQGYSAAAFHNDETIGKEHFIAHSVDYDNYMILFIVFIILIGLFICVILGCLTGFIVGGIFYYAGKESVKNNYNKHIVNQNQSIEESV